MPKENGALPLVLCNFRQGKPSPSKVKYDYRLAIRSRKHRASKALRYDNKELMCPERSW